MCRGVEGEGRSKGSRVGACDWACLRQESVAILGLCSWMKGSRVRTYSSSGALPGGRECNERGHAWVGCSDSTQSVLSRAASLPRACGWRSDGLRLASRFSWSFTLGTSLVPTPDAEDSRKSVVCSWTRGRRWVACGVVSRGMEGSQASLLLPQQKASSSSHAFAHLSFDFTTPLLFTTTSHTAREYGRS